MPKTKKYKSDIKAAIHEIARGFHGVGMIDKQTMCQFDDSCLTPIHEFSAKEIRALRVGLLEADEQKMIDSGAMKRGKYRTKENAQESVNRACFMRER